MTAKFKLGMRIPLLCTVFFCGIVAQGQAAQPTAKNDALTIAKNADEQIQVGQKPWAILTMINPSDQPVIIDESMYWVYVYGKMEKCRQS